MHCPFCESEDLTVRDSRPTGGQIRRRRQCVQCGGRFTTYEEIASPTLKVRKRSGDLEPFERGRLVRLLERLTRGRPGATRVDAIVRGIEAELVESNLQVLPSWQLAEKIHERLKELDDVAAQRLALNYLAADGQVRFSPEAPASQLALPLLAPQPSPPASGPSDGEPPRPLTLVPVAPKAPGRRRR